MRKIFNEKETSQQIDPRNPAMHIVLIVEVLIIFLTFLSLLAASLSWLPAPAHLILLSLAALLTVIDLFVFPFRWQIVPAALVVFIGLVAIFLGWEAGRVLSIAGYGLATLSLLLSLALSLGLPVRDLPEPSGPHKVGVTSVKRSYAPSTHSAEAGSSERGLSLRIWYPAALAPGGSISPEPLWSEFGDPDHFFPLERFLTKYLRLMTTSSLKDAQLAQLEGPRRVVIYNHALLSIASENTLLMEELASHGYIVIGVRHEDQRNEFASLRKAIGAEAVAAEDGKLRDLGTAKGLSRAERSALALKVYQETISLTEIVKRRAEDSKYVLDQLAQILDAVPQDANGISFDQGNVALVGLSLGGAVSTELCKADSRCAVVVNLDGGIFGTDIDAPVSVPYLMLYSESNEGGNDFLKAASGSTFEEGTIVGATHFDFHDATILLPVLKWVGLFGKINGDNMIDERNRRVRDFLGRVY